MPKKCQKCQIYAHKKNISPRYAENMLGTCPDRFKTCLRYAQDIQIMRHRYAQEIQKICPEYDQDMQKIC